MSHSKLLQTCLCGLLLLCVGQVRGLASGTVWGDEPAPAHLLLSDTLLPADIEYIGYRLHVRNVVMRKSRGDRQLITCEVVNTGRRPVALGPGFPARFLQTAFDHSLSAGGLLPLGLPIRAALLDSRLTFEVGQWQKELEFWVEVGDDAEALALTTDDYERREVELRRRNAQPIAAEEPPATALASTIPAVEAAVLSEPAVLAKAEPSNCVDLAVTGMRVLISDRSSATLQFTITNLGSRAMPYSEVPKGLPLDVFLSGSPRLTASAKQVGQVDLSARLTAKAGGTLAPGASITLVERVDTKSATRYTGVLVARLDAGQALLECDDTNNEASTLLSD